MPAAKKLQTNFTAGELSPRIEGRPDLAKFFNGCKTLENFLVYPQGGAFRRPGTRFVKEVKTSAKKTRLIEFIVSNSNSFVLEFGEQYIRFYKNGAPILSAGVPYEIVSPYFEQDLSYIQYRQSVDVMYLAHPTIAPQKLSHFSDTNWTIGAIPFNPPPTFEEPNNLLTATLTPGAASGSSVTFTASAAVFLSADVGRRIIYGSAVALITQLGPSAGAPTPNTVVIADIVSGTFPTSAILSGDWYLADSPQTTLDPNKRAPLDARVVLTAGSAAFRSSDLGKYIKVYGGIVFITHLISATEVWGTILSTFTDTDATDPAAAPAGTWTLESTKWKNGIIGYPRAVEFHEGRLVLGGTTTYPTTWWASMSDDYENFSLGSLADHAIEYTIASRRLNPILWLFSHDELFIGNFENELVALSPQGLPLGGDAIPRVKSQSEIGSKLMSPIPIFGGFLLPDSSGKKVYDFVFDVVQNAFTPTELTLLADHICGDGLTQDKIAYQKIPNTIAYMVRSDGQLLALTYYRVPENIVAWSRIVTDGEIESVAAIPHPDGDRIQVWVIVKRTIGGATKRYVEYFEDQASEFSARNWEQLLTDSAVVYSGAAATSITGLSHLEGEAVDVVADGSYKGRKTVASGAITLSDAATKVEVGLPYTSTLQTMRPSIPNAMVEGYKRKWNAIFLRLQDSIGATVNGEEVLFNAGGQAMDGAPALFTGDKQVKPLGWDANGYITVIQPQPYPLTILAIFGEVEFAEQIG